jgi:hypothetical protein
MKLTEELVRRRTLLCGIGAASAAPLAMPIAAQSFAQTPEIPEPFGLNPGYRIGLSLERRQLAAARSLQRPAHLMPAVGGNQFTDVVEFSKGIRHNDTLQCERDTLGLLHRALEATNLADIDVVYANSRLPAVNPTGGNGLLDCGRDTVQYQLAEPPRIGAPALAQEALELSWAALCRDVPFSAYQDNDTARRALLSLFGGSVDVVPVETALFQPSMRRIAGPYVSQFLLQKSSLGGINQSFQGLFAVPDADYMTSWDEFFQIQNGASPHKPYRTASGIAYPYSGRCLASLVHGDFPAQFYMYAAQQLFDLGASALNPHHPYRRARRQTAFVSFGLPHCFALLNRAACQALQVAWFYKWRVYRRLRPEEYFGYYHLASNNAADFPIDRRLQADATLAAINSKYGGYLLPQAYPEGSPLHPAYPAGHAVVAGACGTLLKLFFDPEFPIFGAVEAAPDGRSLMAYHGRLTVGDEIDKLMWNLSFGRCFAGIHWRSDCEEGIRLGEQVADDIMRDLALFQAEPREASRYRNFDGDEVSI